MNLLKYDDYLIEKEIFEMLKESKLVFSNRFINIISKIKDDKVSSSLISLYNKDVDKLSYNFIDITDDKGRVSFTPDNKAKEFTSEDITHYKVIESQRYLTHKDVNDKIFEALGYKKEGREVWSPDVGTIGTIESEVFSESSGKTYCLFAEKNGDNTTVLNKDALQVSELNFDEAVWKSSRNPINIGRLSRAILTSADIDVTPRDIELFVNKYKATYDFISDETKRFGIVKGNDISKWYGKENYIEGDGPLNNSCMASVPSSYFDIYRNNRESVSMIVLYDDDGDIEVGEYRSDLIKGRALLWECIIDGSHSKFMDRVYTTHDSDVELFKQYAEKNGMWYKESQSMYPDNNITNGTNSKRAQIVADLGDVDWEEYPYMDTLCYIYIEDNMVSNRNFYTKDDGENVYADRMARDTDGDWMDIEGEA